jgi:hypothetical protein
MDAQTDPAVVQAIIRHARTDMTLYYSHSSKRSKLYIMWHTPTI